MTHFHKSWSSASELTLFFRKHHFFLMPYFLMPARHYVISDKNVPAYINLSLSLSNQLHHRFEKCLRIILRMAVLRAVLLIQKALIA